MKYGPEYVLMLSRMVKKFLGRELICLSDQPNPVKTYKLLHYEGFWSKMELFSPENRFLRPCLYLDLDTYLFDDCRELLFEPEDLWLIRDFYNQDRSNSGVMVIPKDTSEIWENHFKTERRVDGDFLTTQKHKVLQDKFPWIMSYKVNCKNNPVGKVCCFHGQPKPHNVSGWAKETWQNWTSPNF